MKLTHGTCLPFRQNTGTTARAKNEVVLRLQRAGLSQVEAGLLLVHLELATASDEELRNVISSCKNKPTTSSYIRADIEGDRWDAEANCSVFNGVDRAPLFFVCYSTSSPLVLHSAEL